MKSTKILALLMALMMCVALAACGGNEAPPAEGDAPTLNLGFSGPLTGENAIYGQAAQNGALIAIEEINAANELQIKFNPLDDESDPEKAVNVYRLLQDWEADAIIGCVTSGACDAVAAEAVADRVFMLTPSASSPVVTEGRDNVYQLCFSDLNQGTASAQYITEHELATKVAVIYNNADTYSSGIYQTFVEAAEAQGLEIVSTTTFTKGDTDFSVQLTKAQENGAELVFLPIYYQPASLILQQAKDMGYAPKFFGCDGLDGILGMEGFDAALAEGLILLTPFAADAADAANFVEKYEATYGETPNQFAANGYDSIYAMYQAVQEADIDLATATSAEICEALIAVFASEDFSVDGITGTGMTWNANGEVTKQPKAVVIQDGAYVGM